MRTWLGLAMVCALSACPQEESQASEGGTDETGAATDTGTGASTGEAGSESPGTSADETGDGQVCETLDPGGIAVEETMVPEDCVDPLDNCKADEDRDGVFFGCDNAVDVTNPAQHDTDADGIGDAADLCPVVPGVVSGAQPDKDKDGVGDACDLCPSSTFASNMMFETAAVPYRYWFRAAPVHEDFDGDGVGDMCDNCPTTPNCAGFSGGVLDGPPLDDPDCQADADQDGIGDACESVPGTGYGDHEDVDGDGLANAIDHCPRLVATRPCDADEDCPAAECVEGVCNHADHDGDGVGDACDTCPSAPNPEQVLSKAEADVDDADGDFIGAACEGHQECEERPNAVPPAFFDVSVDGVCCVLTWPGDDALRDPDGRPLRAACDDETQCRAVPPEVLASPGVATMWPRCEAALADACKEQASPVTLDDVDGDLAALWSYACRLPPRDQDFDGVPDTCDLCPFAHDPLNEPFVDANGMLWPNDGRYCNGEYNAANYDPANGCWPE